MHHFLCQTEFDPILTRPSFFLSAFTAATYIFTTPPCTTTIITLDPCALNAEFLHFILRFNDLIKFHNFADGYLKDRIGGERQGDFTDNSIILDCLP